MFSLLINLYIFILDEIKNFWKTVAEISAHCILLVNSTETRMNPDDFKIVKFLSENLFEQSIKDRIILVNTKTTNKKLIEKDEVEFNTWLL